MRSSDSLPVERARYPLQLMRMKTEVRDQKLAMRSTRPRAVRLGLQKRRKPNAQLTKSRLTEGNSERLREHAKLTKTLFSLFASVNRRAASHCLSRDKNATAVEALPCGGGCIRCGGYVLIG